MSAASTSDDSGDGSGGGEEVDPCGGVASGLADAISSGALDFGGQVSEMDYECAEPIENEEQFVAAEEKQAEIEANGGKKESSPLVIKPQEKYVNNDTNETNVTTEVTEDVV